jgi:hypothetical protein
MCGRHVCVDVMYVWTSCMCGRHVCVDVMYVCVVSMLSLFTIFLLDIVSAELDIRTVSAELDIRTVSEWYLFVFFILLHLLGTLNSSCKDNQVSQVDQELPSLSEDMSSSQS